ncbi:hypothetical protein Q0S40_24780, partial [Escherichia coli :H25]
MSWKRSLKVGDLDDGQKLEMTCVRCCHVHYLTPVMVMASPEREFLNLDEFRRSAGEGMSWQGPPCAAPQGRHQRVRRRPRLARPQPSVEKVYARHPPGTVAKLAMRQPFVLFKGL